MNTHIQRIYICYFLGEILITSMKFDNKIFVFTPHPHLPEVGFQLSDLVFRFAKADGNQR